MIYEWSAAKARINLQKHGVSFEEASTVFLDPFPSTFLPQSTRVYLGYRILSISYPVT
ncbi:MAG: BrnT family toxin [Candidatus Korobacteraceae bacterium]